MKFSFCLHIHQPVGNFDDVIEKAFQSCYKPMLDEFSKIKTGLHISGSLLEWLEKHYPEFITGISAAVQSGNMELLSSGRYEPVLPVFRRDDIIMQIRDYSEHLRKLCGTSPAGLWLTERVWEPQLASLIAEAGLNYAILDDAHLVSAGVRERELFKPWITEDAGSSIRLLGGNMGLRYKIPFAPVDEVIEHLQNLNLDDSQLVLYADDGEKFGVWPGTAELCYNDDWLSRFISEISSADWIETILPSEAASMKASGPLYVPAMSYSEMGDWALTPAAKEDLESTRSVLEEHDETGKSYPFLFGGFWRNFFSLYPESNDLRARVLLAEDIVKRSGSESALHHFWRSQCNCSWWHGVFGGIYLPHLRDAVWKELAVAEHRALDILDEFPRVVSGDINNDGLSERLVTGRKLSVMVHRGQGLTISELTVFNDTGNPIPFGHVLTRQTESYHSDVRAAEVRIRTEETIHSKPGAEKGLADDIIIDRWRKVSFTDLAIPADNCFEEWIQAEVGVVDFQDSDIVFSNCRGDNFLQDNAEISKEQYVIRKTLMVDSFHGVVKASSKWKAPPNIRVGMELSFNMLSGAGPDRYIQIDGGVKHSPGWKGKGRGCEILFADEWRGGYIRVELNKEYDIWQCPIESVNLSERGFEKVHQGVSVYISGITDRDGRLDISMILEVGAEDES